MSERELQLDEYLIRLLKALDMLTQIADEGLLLIRGMETANNPPATLRFDAPVGTQAERDRAELWPGDWFDATGFATLYSTPPTRHTGADLNRPNWKDAGQPVYASADGLLEFSGVVKGWQGGVVVIKHMLENGDAVWTRYAHIKINPELTVGSMIKRGAQIGVIADYLPAGPAGDHLHFDVARIDLGAAPGDWPGLDVDRLRRDYVDPLEFVKERHV